MAPPPLDLYDWNPADDLAGYAALSTAPPEGSIVICLDEMEPESAKSTPGNWLVRAQTQAQAAGAVRAAERAR
jgi:hypothetical protein